MEIKREGNWQMIEEGSNIRTKIYKDKARQISEDRVFARALEAKRAHDKARKEARSARRATGHSRKERNRKKMKIPSQNEGESSITYYTSD